MDTIDTVLWVLVAAIAVVGAYVAFRHRRGYVAALVLLAIALVFLGHWLHTLGALQ